MGRGREGTKERKGARLTIQDIFLVLILEKDAGKAEDGGHESEPPEHIVVRGPNHLAEEYKLLS